MDIGEKIKSLRISNGLTQDELAERSELSKGFISQIERNLASPSISTLEDILQALGSNLNRFFSEEIEEQIVFTEKDYFESNHELTTKNWLVPNAQKNHMEAIRYDLAEGGRTELQSPSEAEFFGYVLKGKLSLNIGNKHLSVKKGETFYYKGTKEHYIQSIKGCSFIWLSSPPIF